MSEKKKDMVLMKTDTTENWEKAEDKYIPAPFTILVYQDEDEAPRIKISDGVHTLGQLPFITAFSSPEYKEDGTLNFG